MKKLFSLIVFMILNSTKIGKYTFVGSLIAVFGVLYVSAASSQLDYTQRRIIPLSDFISNKNSLDRIADESVKIAGSGRNNLGSKDVCEYEEHGDFLIVNAICLINNTLPEYDFRDNIESIWSSVIDVNNIFDDDSSSFTYEGASLVYGEQIIPIGEILPKKQRDLELLFSLYKKNFRLKIPKKSLIVEKINQYSIYAVDKNITDYGSCARKNFLVAYGLLNKLYLEPGKIYNINKVLARRTDYCDGGNGQKYMFYMGVCGASSQMFRGALINPYLEVTKRAPHSQRYVKYYGEYIYGDDAAIYEMQKQFEVKNTSEYPMYFKTLEVNGKHLLVTFIPTQADRVASVTRRQTDNLKGFVQKQVKSIFSDEIFSTQKWTSTYVRKNYKNN